MKWVGYTAAYLIPVIILLPSIILRFSSIEPFHRGYFCLDRSIQYPFVGYQTVPTYLCAVIWLIFCIIHLSLVFIAKKSCKLMYETMYKLILGFSICMLITDVGKYSVGRLRPYFLSVCNCLCGFMGGNSVLLYPNQTYRQVPRRPKNRF